MDIQGSIPAASVSWPNGKQSFYKSVNYSKEDNKEMLGMKVYSMRPHFGLEFKIERLIYLVGLNGNIVKRQYKESNHRIL